MNEGSLFAKIDILSFTEIKCPFCHILAFIHSRLAGFYQEWQYSDFYSALQCKFCVSSYVPVNLSKKSFSGFFSFKNGYQARSKHSNRPVLYIMGTVFFDQCSLTFDEASVLATFLGGLTTGKIEEKVQNIRTTYIFQQFIEPYGHKVSSEVCAS